MLSSTEQPIEFDLSYKGLDVRVDETPNIIINHSIATNIEQEDLFIKINGIKYIFEIYEILKSNGNESLLIDLGNTYSHFISFFQGNRSTNRSVLMKLTTNNLAKLVNSGLIDNKLLFKIAGKIDYEVYSYHHGSYCLKDIKRSPYTYIHDLEREHRVNPSEEQVSLVIEKNKYTSKLRTEFPLGDEPINNQSLSSAIENLKLAAQGLIEGNFNSVIFNTRNALSNSLIEKVNASPTEKKSALKKDIKEACLLNIPAKDKDDYKEILNHVGSILASLLSINHKYAHENQNTITMRPLHADLELLYFSASVLTKYLTTLNNGKF
jgi:hypothetical protein